MIDWLRKAFHRGRERREREDYKELEERAREDVFEIMNITKLADVLDSLGFETLISSEGGKDASDLELTIRKKR